MNEKIRELRQQATIIVGAESGFAFDREVLDEEKFAELIVKETLQVARAGIEYGPSMEEVVYKYFGVEE